MGVATIYKPLEILLIYFLFIFLISCAPVNLSKKNEIYEDQTKKKLENQTNNLEIPKTNELNIQQKNENKTFDTELKKNITVLFSNNNEKSKITSQFVKIIQLALFDKNLGNVTFDINFFDDEEELNKIINKTKENGKIYIGPLENKYTEVSKNYCSEGVIFFSFSSNPKLADKCVYLINFFPKNEVERIFEHLDFESKVALLYPENEYGYMINNLIDDIANKSEAIIINRSSYKNDLSNVRTAIKELGQYELRKYELERQKQILISKNDDQSIARLRKLEKFKTTNDYDFTHVLIADYGINLLQVAPLLPYYDIDPNIVQFIGTGVIDDQNFFYEPSLQRAIFPGVEINKRKELLNNYSDLYDDNFIRISTLPYDLVGLLNFVYSKNMSLYKFVELLNNENIYFDGLDGKFTFNNNIIERKLDMLQINNGKATSINK